MTKNQRNRPPTHDVSNYRILRVLQAGAGEPEIILGTRGRCRYCGATDPAMFRNVAHTFPEAFGNKWIKSVDECDACNTSFGSFDDALAKSVGAVLTVGGTQGKRNKVRQTGRTTGPASIRHSVEDGQRSISMRINGTPFEQHVGFIPRTMEIALTTPAGTERFVPALGYRALVKMALAMLPTEEMDRFANTVAWLREPVGNLLHDMTVGLSFGNVGNAPPILAAALLRRTLDLPELPDTVFVTTLGSVCLQIPLTPDAQEGAPAARPSITWTNVLNANGAEPFQIPYGTPVHLDWRRSELEPPSVESIRTIINPRTNALRMVPIIRQSALASPA